VGQIMDKDEKVVNRKFLPLHHHQKAFLNDQQVTQGTMSVEDFIAYFDSVRMHFVVDEEEEQVVARLLGALIPEISDVVQS
jgi:hypothetical protein